MPLVSGTDTYADVAFADSYIRGRLHAQGTWAALADEEKESALELAMIHMDYLYTYLGSLASETQAISWPRSNVVDKQGRVILETVIPDGIKKAQCELAILWAENDQLTPPADFFTKDSTDSQQVRSEKLGDLEKQYFKNDAYIWELQQGYMKLKIYPIIDVMVKPYVSSTASDPTVNLMI